MILRLKKFIKTRLKNIVMVKSQCGNGKEKASQQFHLEMQPYYRNKKDFVDTLGHEMVHLYQMANVGDTGNHNKLFYSFRPKIK